MCFECSTETKTIISQRWMKTDAVCFPVVCLVSGCLAGWCVDWLAGVLTGWLAGVLTGWLVGWSVDWLVC